MELNPMVKLPLPGGWRAELSKEWDVLGPFPIHAREQHYLSPSFPLDLNEQIDYSKTWPSSYADGGKVGWSKAWADKNGNLRISYPNIRWANLRSYDGWAALQHHSVLHTVLTLYPPADPIPGLCPPHLLVELLQGSFFTLLPVSQKGQFYTSKKIPTWYSGNIYALERAPLQTVVISPPPSTTAATEYHIFLSGDYEIRLFGDPKDHGNEIPTLSINFQVDIEPAVTKVVREPVHDIIPDFVDGMAFGDAIGVGLRSVEGWWNVTSASLIHKHENISVSLLREVCLAPTQTRIIPIRIQQNNPTKLKELSLQLTVTCDSKTALIPVTLNIQHSTLWTDAGHPIIKSTYFFGTCMPTGYLVVPPKKYSKFIRVPRPPILALHGAGVDIFANTFWPDALPRQDYNWIVIPTGRTSWGLDWHGPSTQDARGTVSALREVLEANSVWKQWNNMEKDSKVVLVGHSNGGQGSWYFASRFPDSVLAVVPAAGYIKSQAYIPLTMSRSAHFIDPSLRGILESSLAPDDNDLFMSNLVDTPVLAIHGGNDNNVPVWHSRENISVIKTWNPSADATYREDANQLHWYEGVFKNLQVKEFLQSTLAPEFSKSRSSSFTLTVAIPSESGPMHGWRIHVLKIPGRLARLQVNEKPCGDGVDISATNVYAVSIDLSINDINKITINEQHVQWVKRTSGTLWLESSQEGWVAMDSAPSTMQLSGRLQTILTTAAPITVVVPETQPSHELRIALRLVHDLLTFFKLDAEIISSVKALEMYDSGKFSTGNIIVVGGAQTTFVQKHLNAVESAFKYSDGNWRLNERSFSDPSLAILFLQRHPTSPDARALYLMSSDDDGLERAARLFPARSGIVGPDWLVVGPKSDKIGAAGIHGAGVWKTGISQSWSWNEQMSWLD